MEKSTEMSEEIWIICKNWEYYEVSNFGRVRAISRVIIDYKGKKYFKKIRMLSPSVRKKDNYLEVHLTSPTLNKTQLVHRLVAESFINNPENKKEVNHKNFNKQDNKLSNLEWVTSSENSIHAVKGNVCTFHRGMDRPDRKIDTETVINIRKRYRETNESYSSLSSEYNLAMTTVRYIIQGKKWAHIPDYLPYQPKKWYRKLSKKLKLSKSDIDPNKYRIKNNKLELIK